MIRPAITIFLSFFLTQTILAQWKPLGPYGGPISLLESDNKVAFAAGPAGSFFRSADGGKSWQITSKGLTTSSATALYQSDSLLLLGTGGAGVYRSTDGGISWAASSRFDPTLSGSQPAANAFLRSGQFLYAATRDGVYRSSNNGQNWLSVTAGLYTRDGVFSLLNVPGTKAILAGTGNGIYRTIDDGTTWALLRSPIAATSNNSLEGNVFALEQINGMLMAGAYGQGFFRSTDLGANWTAANSGLPFGTTVSVIRVKNGVIYIGTDTGVYTSTNNGNVWTQIANFPSDASISGITFVGNSLLISTSAEGIYRSDDGGKSWVDANAGLLADTEMLVTSGNKLWVVSGENVVRSTDGGKSWRIVRYRLTPTETIQALVRDGNTLYLTSGNLYRSTNDGDTWERVNAPQAIPDGVYLTQLYVSGKDIIAATLSNGIIRSTDGGVNWKFLSRDGLPSADRRPSYVTKLKNAIYLGFQGGGLYRSTNDGTNWEAVKDVRNNADVWTITAVGDTLYAGTNSESLYRSVDNGTTWARADKGITSSIVRSILPTPGGLFVGTFKGVGVSTTRGVFWRRYNNGLPLLQNSADNTATENLRMFPLTTENGMLYGSSLYGVWTRPLNEPPYITPDPTIAQSCVNGVIPVSYRISDTFEEKNAFSLQISGPDGTFKTFTTARECISPGTADAQGFAGCVLTFRLPAGFAPGDNYKMRIVASSPYTTSQEIPIKLTPNPIPAKPVISSDSTTFRTVQATAYQWLLNDRPIPGATSQTFNPKGFPGVYGVLVYNECNGSAASDPLYYLVTATEPTFDDEVSVFPNPADDVLTVKVPRSGGATSLRLLRTDGAVLSNQPAATGAEHRLSIGKLPTGTYLLHIQQGDRQTTKRVMKK
ncbi:T9SS type A sorting domain-containing protein [Spirosoma taeanense]|uniref:T9SS type A sorting domain-containing protein n=1 Tax=Spirosoma taeanense TaxID=2735870 RepID=A0A6M5Y7X1_9BACT|nr:T9SS type A sorting domain-containing protein [Spirosoma taeanense]QJW90438.1 T9SS type A sorting domain-containing protein [Spirosoma taeanense]